MKRLLLFCLLLLTGAGLMAQNSVQITVTALPPFDPFLQDYLSQPGKLQVIVRNTTNTQLTVKLLATLTGDNGVVIATAPGYQPLQPLTLGALQTRLLNVNDLKNLIDLSQVTVQGMDKAALLRGQALPQGEYQLCLQAVDIQSNRPLSIAELGCTRIPVKSVEPPILIAPLCDQDVKPMTPQNIVFTWSPPAGVRSTQVEYTLRVVELPIQNIDPNVFIDAVVLPASGVEVKGLRINSFLYSIIQPALKPGKKYAWRVQARDPLGKLVFLNDGKSPVCSFQYGEPLVAETKPKPPTSVSNMILFSFCGQTVQVKTTTNPDLDHFSGTGSLLLTSPVKQYVNITFNDLTVRPFSYAPGKYADTKGFSDFRVVTGKLEASLKNALADPKLLVIKTDPHTGGDAKMSYQAVRLEAGGSATFNPATNAFVAGGGNSEKAEIQSGLVWNSPISLTQGIVVPKSGNSGPVQTVSTSAPYTSNLTVEVPGAWYPIKGAGQADSKGAGLTIPFGKAYAGAIADLKGFDLTLDASSYLTVSNGILTAHLTGNVLVPSGRKDTKSTNVPFQETNGIAFTAQLDDPQVPVSILSDGEVRLFLSFTSVNVQLGDLFGVSDLPWPQWTKGVSCEPDLWMGKMVYAKDADHPSGGDYLGWTTAPLNPVVNRGNGYESTNATRKGLKLATTYLGFQGKITQVIALIKNTEFKVGHLVGQVYVPFIAGVGDLQIMIEKYGLGDADVWFDKSERTLVSTPAGDRVTMRCTGGYFDGGYFYPDLSFSVFNANSPTRGLNAQNIQMAGGVIELAITPKGDLVSNYKDTKAEALYGGNSQKTAFLNGLDYNLARVILVQTGTGNQCRLSFNGKLILGDKIITEDQYLYEVLFEKPKDDAFAFVDTAPAKGANGTITIPTNGNFTPVLPGKKGGGPRAEDDPNAINPMLADALAKGYVLERSAPASALLPVKAQTLHGSYSTGTGSFQADFTIYSDDPTYGNGFRAVAKMMVLKPVNSLTQATILAGKAQGVKYWFAGFKYESKTSPGIPLFLNLEAYGFEGRLYSHMAHTGNPTDIYNDNYVPNASVSFGLYAGMPIQSKADKGKLLWGKTAVEITFQGYAPNQIRLRGDANIEQLNGTGDASTSRIQGFANVLIDLPGKAMTGQVVMTKCNMVAACANGTADFYVGPSGLVASVGNPANPLEVKAFCGVLGSLTPTATGYFALYATSGPVAGFEWLPTGIGIRAHVTAKILDLQSPKSAGGVGVPWANLVAQANTDLTVIIRPSVSLRGTLNSTISLDVGYEGYTTSIANEVEALQISLPDPVCIAYNKRICYAVIGGVNVILGVKNVSPILRVNGDVSDMCFDDGTVQGECKGIIGWLADGVDVVIDAAGTILKKGGELIEDIGGAIKDGFCGIFGC